MSAGRPSYTSSRWLTSWAPDAMTRVGRSPTMRFMRSKKWHVFSTSVPPVVAVKRFQSPTLVRNGKRCSRIATITRAADGAGVDEADELGRRRHVAVLQADPRHDAGRPAGVELDEALGSRRSSCTAASRRGRGGRSPARRRRRRRGCGSGVTTTTASHSPLASRSRWSSNTAHAGAGGVAARRPADVGVGVGDRGHGGAGDGADVLDVLDAHHPGADDPVAGRACA